MYPCIRREVIINGNRQEDKHSPPDHERVDMAPPAPRKVRVGGRPGARYGSPMPGTSAERKPGAPAEHREVPPSTRRQQRRAEMFGLIKQAARTLLSAGGPDAVSVRAIAREIAVTPPAIYRYYASIQDLVEELRADILAELDEWLGIVRDKVADDSPATRAAELVKAFRRWVVDHPGEFWLVLRPGSGDSEFIASAREPRIAARFLREYLCAREYALDSCASCASSGCRAEGDIPGSALAEFMPIWARLVGTVIMEISGQEKWLPVPVAKADSESFFEAQIAQVSAQFTDPP